MASHLLCLDSHPSFTPDIAQALHLTRMPDLAGVFCIVQCATGLAAFRIELGKDFDNRINTSLAAPGALGHRLQRRNTCNT